MTLLLLGVECSGYIWPVWVTEERRCIQDYRAFCMYLAACWNCSSCATLKFVGVVGGWVRHNSICIIHYSNVTTCVRGVAPLTMHA